MVHFCAFMTPQTLILDGPHGVHEPSEKNHKKVIILSGFQHKTNETKDLLFIIEIN